MFDFERLDVYNRSREVRIKIFKILSNKKQIDRDIQDQFKWSALA